jgi:uncharacterized membrane protein YkoI
MNKTWLAVIVGAVIIAGVGFGVNQLFAGESGPALTTEEATQKVEERYPGSVTEIELDNKGTRQVYEIELEGSGGYYEIKMDANTGKILKMEQGQRVKEKKPSDDPVEGGNESDEATAENDPGREKTAKEQKRISYDEAKAIALNKFDGTIKEIELDEDDGRWIYEVELKKGKQEADMEIDAYTGEILFLSVEYDD